MSEIPNPDSYGYALDLQRRREEWEARRRAEADVHESQKKQAALAAYLRRRGEEWAATTGEKPTLDDLATWRREYMAEIEHEYQREQQKKLDKALENYHF